jgi:hypothetical protein
MLSCKDATRLIATDAWRAASFRGRLALGLHLAMCRYCRAYARSLRLIGETARRLYGTMPADGEHAQATLDTLQQAIRQSHAD